MDLSTLLAFSLTSLALVVVPGPSVLFVIGRALAHGRRTAVLTVLGNAIGIYVLVALVAVGLGPLLQRSESLLLVVKLLGAAYLIILGVRALRVGRVAPDPAREKSGAPRPSTSTILREGFVVGVLNPKALVFFAAVLPQFVSPTAGTVPVQIATLGAVFVVIALASDSVWGLVAGTARAWFAADERRLTRAQQGGGMMMIGLGGALTVEAARS